jgi:hypothetical protein
MESFKLARVLVDSRATLLDVKLVS